MEWLSSVLPTVFALSSATYLGLAVFVSRSSPQSIIGYFLFLIGMLVAGTVFTYGSTDPHLYGIGRTLTFFAAGFLPVAFYAIYRQYTSGLPGPLMLATLSVIPVLTVLLAISNPLHNMIWDIVETPAGPRYTELTEHYWFNRIHSPFAYGLFGYSLVALAARLSSIAPAHRRTILVLIGCATFPFIISIANNFLGMGPPDFPFLSLTLTLLLPVYAYASVSLRVYEFSPIAYQTLFNHVRDPIVVLDNRQRIICANRKATEMLGRSEAELLGRRLWEDVPEARAVLEQASELDMTQTLKLGTQHVYEVSVAALVDALGRRQGTVVVCRDVTERRRALSQLADSEHLIRTLIETSSNGILRFARDDSAPARQFRCVFANRAAEAHLGSDSDSLVGRYLAELEQLDPARLSQHFDDPEKAASPVSFETLSRGRERRDLAAHYRRTGGPGLLGHPDRHHAAQAERASHARRGAAGSADRGIESPWFREGGGRLHPVEFTGRRALSGPESLQVHQRPLRPPGGGLAAQGIRPPARILPASGGRAGPTGRR